VNAARFPYIFICWERLVCGDAGTSRNVRTALRTRYSYTLPLYIAPETFSFFPLQCWITFFKSQKHSMSVEKSSICPTFFVFIPFPQASVVPWEFSHDVWCQKTSKKRIHSQLSCKEYCMSANRHCHHHHYPASAATAAAAVALRPHRDVMRLCRYICRPNAWLFHITLWLFMLMWR